MTEDYSRDLKKTASFREKVWTVLNERLIPWMIPKEWRNKDESKKYVCFTVGFKKEVHKELRVCQPLNGIAELLDWDYKNVKFSQKDQKKVAIVRLEDFMDFLYPSGAE